jgi:hypothetical protein
MRIMGATPFRYLVNYNKDIQSALDKLRLKVFKEKNYEGANSDTSGSPNEAFENAVTTIGSTGSILDIESVSTSAQASRTSPLTDPELMKFFRTNRPTIKQIDENPTFWGAIERGTARHITIYKDAEPSKIYFVGVTL